METCSIDLPGIYRIINKIDNKFYIGSTQRRIRVRWWDHRRLLRKAKHPNKHLQNAWLKDGEDSFSFEAIENVNASSSREEIQSIEDAYLKNLQPEYNLFSNAILAVRFSHTDATKEKFKLRPKYNHTEESKRLISEKLKGQPKSKSHNRAVSQALKTSSLAIEARKKLYEKKKRVIIQLDKSRERVIMRWPSIKECCETLKIHHSQMSYHLAKKPYYNQVKGYVFVYEDEFQRV